MGVLRVHGTPPSGNTLRVIFVIEELGLEYEIVHVDLRSGGHKHPSFLDLNPFGQVPVLEDGDVKLFESRAITRYLVEKHRPELIAGAYPSALVALEVEAHQFNPPASSIVFEHLFKPHFGGAADQALVAAQSGKLSKVLDIYEARLSSHRYIAGDELTLADLHHVPVINYLLISPERDLIASRPHVLAWAEGLIARPAWKKAAEHIKG